MRISDWSSDVCSSDLLAALTEDDFVAILSDTKASLPQQYKALIGTEGVTVDFAEDGIKAIARIAAEVNAQIENIGARRLQTVLEKLLEEISFEAENRAGRSEEHTSELQTLMSISYAVFCL